ncbi:hypothetical protein K490DRAFT_64818 [Saccharata proteae CBS 121410]|uniref:Uncharacterized protein n=1 Tax=Saccharata proteae CBS 121410 TaxID=1314787 RepID=A0A9P4HY13_9PEZI|nr:hypothetical protein K490DRAFT_64818 [Saccharata proteae CBS 121410]
MAVPCPLPLVEEALRPYIHTRQETLQIRRAVTQHCAGHFRPLDDDDDEQQSLSHLALACPLSPPSPEDAGSGSKARRRQQQRRSIAGGSTGEDEVEFTGLRKKYLDALRAHRAARERYDALSAELNEMRVLDASSEKGGEERALMTDSTVAVGGGGGHDGGVQPYISLLRQRRRLARLQVLQATLDQLADTQANPTRIDLKELLRKRVGEPPNPPSSSSAAQTAGAAGEGDAVRDLVFRLKKDLLLAKRSLDAENGARASVQRKLAFSDDGEDEGDFLGGGKPTLKTQVRALRCARDELISWVEGELAKIGAEDGDQEDEDDAQGARPGDYDDNAESSYEDQVQAMYDRYLSSRTALIEAIAETTTAAAKLQAPSPSPIKQDPSPEKKTSQPSPRPSVPPSAILPHIPSLLQNAQDDRALLQQTTYLRHRLDGSADALRQLVQRLASESHLVPHHATSSREWARAAAEARMETDAFVEESVRSGEGDVEAARAVLEELRSRRERFERLGLVE